MWQLTTFFKKDFTSVHSSTPPQGKAIEANWGRLFQQSLYAWEVELPLLYLQLHAHLPIWLGDDVSTTEKKKHIANDLNPGISVYHITGSSR